MEAPSQPTQWVVLDRNLMGSLQGGVKQKRSAFNKEQKALI